MNTEKISQLPSGNLVNPAVDLIEVSQFNTQTNSYTSIKTPAQRGGQLLAAYTQVNGNPINLNSSSFQPITLSGGSLFQIQNILITNRNSTPQSSVSAAFFDSDKITHLFDIGNNVLQTNLTSASSYIDWLVMQIVAPSTFKTVGNTIYFQRGADIGTKVADLYVFGFPIS